MSHDYLHLSNGITHWSQDEQSDNLLYGTIDFYKWAFLEVGAYQNITRSPAVSGVYGGNRFRLGYTDDPRFTDGQVWQGFRSDWVWETGVAFSPAPQNVNVYVGGTLQNANTYYVDYPRGRVVFNTPQPTSSIVEADFAHRTVHITKTSEPWFQKLMFDSFDISRNDFLVSTSGGQWNELAENRVQLPAIGVEVVGTSQLRPYQLGGGQWQYQDILYYIYAENETQRNKLRDIIVNMNDRVIWLYDRARMKEHTHWPFTLDYRGTPISGFWTYPSIVSEDNGLRYVNTRFMRTRAENLDTRNDWLYGAVVRTTAELITPYG